MASFLFMKDLVKKHPPRRYSQSVRNHTRLNAPRTARSQPIEETRDGRHRCETPVGKAAVKAETQVNAAEQ